MRKSATDIFNQLHDPHSLGGLAKEFFDWLKAKNYSPKTIYAHKWYLGFFVKWCDQRSIYRPNDITREIIECYKKYLCRLYSKQCRGILTESSRTRYLHSVYLFFKWLAQNDHVLYNPVQMVHGPREPFHLPHNVLTASQADQIINQPNVSTPCGIRDRTILETLYSTGIRRQELIDMKEQDIDFTRGTVIVTGKGQKDRVVPIGERALRWIKKYQIEVRPSLALNRSDLPLFLTNQKKSITSVDTLTPLVAKYVRAAGQQGSCHIFRRSMATLMLENGADVRYIQEILGHVRLSTTEIYTKVSIKKLKEVHRRTHPADLGQSPKISDVLSHHGPSKPLKKEKNTQLTRFWNNTISEEWIVLGNQFFDWQQANGYAARTVESYQYDLKFFIEWLYDRGINRAQDVTKRVMDRYQRHLSRVVRKTDNQPISPTTRHHRLVRASKFFDWLMKNEYLLYNPAVNIVLPKISKRLPRQILTVEEVERIMSQPNLEKPSGVRDRAMLETLYSTGIRRQELAQLKIPDIDVDRRTVLVHGKGKKDRVIPIGERALRWIETYLAQARQLFHPSPDDPTLFLNRFGQPFSIHNLGTRVGKYIKIAGIEKSGACHIFRHTMATLMLENGADVRYLQELLGHSELSTTEIYTRVSIGKLKEVHNQTHPAALFPLQTDTSIEQEEI